MNEKVLGRKKVVKLSSYTIKKRITELQVELST